MIFNVKSDEKEEQQPSGCNTQRKRVNYRRQQINGVRENEEGE